MKKALCLILAALMLFAVTGCNNNTASGDTVKLGIPGGNSLTPQEIIDGFVAEYSGKYNLEIDDTPWGEFKTKLNLGIASGTAPALYIMDSGYVADAGYSGANEDLKPLIDRDLNADEYVSALFSGTDMNGHVWGVPHAMNATMIFYNKDLFDKKGVEYPAADWTWDDMLEKAKALSYDEDGDGKNDYYGISWANNITVGWLPRMLSHGLEPVSADFTKAQLDTPEARAAWEEHRTWKYDWKIIPDDDFGTLYPNWWQGKIAMMIGVAANINTFEDNAPDLNYDVQVLPVGPKGSNNCVYVPNMWAIYSRADETSKEAAWDFIKYYYNEESQEICAKYNKGGFPIRKSVYENMGETKPANIKGIIEGIDQRGHTLSEGPGWSEWRTIIDKAYTDYISEKPTKSFDQIMTDVQADVQRVLDEANAKLAQ
ncbi:MAG: sugar ABC transporter substrate-binding protein [Clostridia bacterium]|nr:sugar ABC transporter substrate-binding protein [Clostridia bacterium]